jgi:hypothetical protein
MRYVSYVTYVLRRGKGNSWRCVHQRAVLVTMHRHKYTRYMFLSISPCCYFGSSDLPAPLHQPTQYKQNGIELMLSWEAAFCAATQFSSILWNLRSSLFSQVFHWFLFCIRTIKSIHTIPSLWSILIFPAHLFWSSLWLSHRYLTCIPFLLTCTLHFQSWGRLITLKYMYQTVLIKCPLGFLF